MLGNLLMATNNRASKKIIHVRKKKGRKNNELKCRTQRHSRKEKGQNIDLQILGPIQYRGFQQTISKADMQCYVQQIDPRYPTYYYHKMDTCLHMNNPRQIKLSGLCFPYNVVRFYWSLLSAQDLLKL
mgnify:FL=1